MVVMTVLTLAMAASMAGNPPDDATQTYAVIVESGHFYLLPETTDGQHLKLQIDTGGGYKLYAFAAKRLALSLHEESTDGTTMTMANWPAFKAGRSVPLSPLLGHNVPVDSHSPIPGTYDGVIGGPALLGHAWVLDYPGQRLIRLAKNWRPDSEAHRTALGFQTSDDGKFQGAYARITLYVDGAPVDLLLDTGATARPTAAGKRIASTPTTAGIGVASYITTSVMNRWHRTHPHWRIVEDGDDLMPHTRLIEVPRVTIANWSVGPIWFTERSDADFHRFMSSYMDKQVEGAAGGNIFGHFVMTIDYVNKAAYFQCANGCQAVTPPPAP